MKALMMGVALAALTAGGAGAADKAMTVAVSIPAADHGWTGGVVFQAERAKQLLEARHPGLKIIVKTSPDGASQASALEDLTTQGIDALVTLPQNSDELTDPIRQVKAKGVFITVVDRALSDPSISDLYVAGNNPDLGRVAGEYMKKNMGSGNVVVIRGLPIVIDEERQKGFDTAIAGSGIKVLDKQFGNWSRDDAFKIMQDYLTKYPKIDAVWWPGRRHGGRRSRGRQAGEPNRYQARDRRRRHEGHDQAGVGWRSDDAGRRPLSARHGGDRDGADRRGALRPDPGTRPLHPRCDPRDQG